MAGFGSVGIGIPCTKLCSDIRNVCVCSPPFPLPLVWARAHLLRSCAAGLSRIAIRFVLICRHPPRSLLSRVARSCVLVRAASVCCACTLAKESRGAQAGKGAQAGAEEDRGVGAPSEGEGPQHRARQEGRQRPGRQDRTSNPAVSLCQCHHLVPFGPFQAPLQTNGADRPDCMSKGGYVPQKGFNPLPAQLEVACATCSWARLFHGVGCGVLAWRRRITLRRRISELIARIECQKADMRALVLTRTEKEEEAERLAACPSTCFGSGLPSCVHPFTVRLPTVIAALAKPVRPLQLPVDSRLLC